MTPSDHAAADRFVLEAVGAALSAHPPVEGARIAIAFSGGVDSSVLLDALVRVAGAEHCVALHVHHGLSRNADRWLEHCDEIAQRHGVGFASTYVNVPRGAVSGIEATARDARYRALETMCADLGATQLWLAQHADDQAETVLLQMLRGAGVAGLAAMAPYAQPGRAQLPRVRPLLHLLRAQIEQYATRRALRWIDDESNADTRYARNALRHDVLPALGIAFPGFRDALMRTAAHAASAQRLLDELARLDFAAASRDAGRALSRDALTALDDDRAANLLRYWMQTLALPAASSARLADALRQVRAVGDDHRLRVDHAHHALRLYRGELYWEKGEASEPADETALTAREPAFLTWRGESVWRLPHWRGTFVFAIADTEGNADANAEATADARGTNDAEHASRHVIAAEVLRHAPLCARSRRGGERMRIAAAASNRTLKNLFQERGVPAWARDVPLLYVGDTLVFVPHIGVNRDPAVDALAAGARAAEGGRVAIRWQPDLTIA